MFRGDANSIALGEKQVFSEPRLPNRIMSTRPNRSTVVAVICEGGCGRWHRHHRAVLILIVAPDTGSGEAGASLGITRGAVTERNFE